MADDRCRICGQALMSPNHRIMPPPLPWEDFHGFEEIPPPPPRCPVCDGFQEMLDGLRGIRNDEHLDLLDSQRTTLSDVEDSLRFSWERHEKHSTTHIPQPDKTTRRRPCSITGTDDY